MGALSIKGMDPLPLFLTAEYSLGEEGRTKRLPFMFQDAQVVFYANESELLGRCRRFLFPYRRRILNYEFTKPG